MWPTIARRMLPSNFRNRPRPDRRRFLLLDALRDRIEPRLLVFVKLVARVKSVGPAISFSSSACSSGGRGEASGKRHSHSNRMIEGGMDFDPFPALLAGLVCAFLQLLRHAAFEQDSVHTGILSSGAALA